MALVGQADAAGLSSSKFPIDPKAISRSTLPPTADRDKGPNLTKLVCDLHIRQDEARAVGMDFRRHRNRDVDRDGGVHLVGVSIEP